MDKFKFENLEVWNLSLELSDLVYEITELLPSKEEFNLKSQMIRACTSVSLNIAEGSISASDLEQKRFINIAIRSLIEVIACIRLIVRRNYILTEELIETINKHCHLLFAKLQAFKKSLNKK